MSLLALDSRWRRLHDPDYVCPRSGRSFGGLMDIGFDAPDCWPHAPWQGETVAVGEDVLTADLCRCEGMSFVHGLAPLPIKGSDEVFLFGVWASVSDTDFKAYVADMENTGERFVHCAAWLMNDLPLFESDAPLACDLIAGATAQDRPHLRAQMGPLAEAQTDGISFDALLDIYAASGEDIRPYLAG